MDVDEEAIKRIKKEVKEYINGFDGEVEITVGPYRSSAVTSEVSDDLKKIHLDFYSIYFPESWDDYKYEVIEFIIYQMKARAKERKYKKKINELEAVLGKNKDKQLRVIRDLLNRFEKEIRSIIKTTLSKEDKDWWNTRIPPKIRKKAVSRMKSEKRQDQKRGITGKEYDVMEFLDFSDYEGVIFSNNYRLFMRIFEEKNLFQVFMKEISKMRNKIYHHRTITKNEIVLLMHFLKMTLNVINEYKKEKAI